MSNQNGKAPITQIMVQLNSDGSIGFGLPAPLQTVQDRIFLVGVLQNAVLAAANLTLTPKSPLIDPLGEPISDLRDI